MRETAIEIIEEIGPREQTEGKVNIIICSSFDTHHTRTHLRGLGILTRQDKVKIHLVVNLAIVRSALLEDSINDQTGQISTVVLAKLSLAQQPVLIRVEIDIGCMDARHVVDRKPVRCGYQRGVGLLH